MDGVMLRLLAVTLALTGCTINHNFDDIEIRLTHDVAVIRELCLDSLPDGATDKEVADCVFENMRLINIGIDEEQIRDLIEETE